MSEHPVTSVARNLTAILNLWGDLEDQAEHRHRARIDGTALPGGMAMVDLAPVGSPSEWAEQIAAEELYHLAKCPKVDHAKCRYAEQAADDDGTETPLQSLLYWSEAWRMERNGYALEGRPSIRSEANFIRWSLEWAWENEAHFEDFATDVAAARTQLENVLLAGERSERGVPCLYEACKGIRIVRKLEPFRDRETGRKSWRYDNWHCPRCHREWDESRYNSMVAAAAWTAQREEIGGEIWCSPKYAARQVDRPEATIRAWASKGLLAVVCIIRGKRAGFVRLADVQERNESSRKRAA